MKLQDRVAAQNELTTISMWANVHVPVNAAHVCRGTMWQVRSATMRLPHTLGLDGKEDTQEASQHCRDPPPLVALKASNGDQCCLSSGKSQYGMSQVGEACGCTLAITSCELDRACIRLTCKL
jgi:hypothetical protein